MQALLERTFPSYIFDIRVEQSTRKTKIDVFNANRFSNTLDPQKETYYREDFASEQELINKIKQDFAHEK